MNFTTSYRRDPCIASIEVFRPLESLAWSKGNYPALVILHSRLIPRAHKPEGKQRSLVNLNICHYGISLLPFLVVACTSSPPPSASRLVASFSNHHRRYAKHLF